MDSFAEIWEYVDKYQNDKLNYTTDYIVNYNNCKNCRETDIRTTECYTVCANCGYIIDENRLSNNTEYSSQIETKYNSKSSKSKIIRLQEWINWTNEEKSDYKLKNYISDFLDYNRVPKEYHSNTIETAFKVLTLLKETNGTRRSKVKDGIIIACLKNITNDVSFIKNSCDIKYITNGEKLINNLVAQKKIVLEQKSPRSPYDYVQSVAIKYTNTEVQEKTKKLIKLCEDYDLLIDHTPLSIGIACLYFILTTNDMSINNKDFCKMFNITTVTLSKTVNKLKKHKEKILKKLSQN